MCGRVTMVAVDGGATLVGLILLGVMMSSLSERSRVSFSGDAVVASGIGSLLLLSVGGIGTVLALRAWL